MPVPAAPVAAVPAWGDVESGAGSPATDCTADPTALVTGLTAEVTGLTALAAAAGPEGGWSLVASQGRPLGYVATGELAPLP